MERLIALGAFLKQERHWVLLGLAYTVAWWTPLVWLKVWWLNPASLFAAQPWIVPAFFFLLWARREELQRKRQAQLQQARHTRRPTTEGSLWLLALGCALYFFAHFIHLALAAVLGLVLMLVGVLFRLYGKAFLTTIAGPLAFLFLVVPWLPESATHALERLGFRLYSTLVGAVLTRRAWVFHADESSLLVQGVSMPTHEPLRGMHCLFAMVVFFLAYGLYRRLKLSQTLTLMVFGGAVAFMGHLLRFFLVAVLLRSAPDLASRLAKFNSWPFTGVSLLVTFGLLKLWSRLAVLPLLKPVVAQGRRLNQVMEGGLDRVFAGSGRAMGTTGKVLHVLLMPLVWPLNQLLKGIEWVFRGLGRSSAQAERWLQQQERKRRRKR